MSFLFKIQHLRTSSSDTEKIISNFLQTTELLRIQYNLTLKTYRSKNIAELNDLDLQWKEQKEEAKILFEKLYEENEDLDDETRYFSAKAESGLDEVEQLQNYEAELIQDKYNAFFDSFSKSILIATYSNIEAKIKALCDVYSSIYSKKIIYDDLKANGGYLNTSIKYLTKVLDLDVTNLEQYRSKIDDYRKIRNQIVHNNSEYSSAGELREIKKIVGKFDEKIALAPGTTSVPFVLLETKYDKRNILVVKKKEFVLDFIDISLDFLEEVIWQVDIRHGHQLLKLIIEHWFSHLYSSIELLNFSATKKGDKKTIEFSLLSQSSDLKLGGRLKINKSKETKICIFNQVEKPEKITPFISDYCKENTITRLFKLMNCSNSKFKYEIYFY